MNRYRVLTAVATATLLAFGASAAFARGVITLMDGSKLEAVGTQLFIVDRSGKKAPAKDGRYRSRNGRVLLLQNGKLKELGALRVTPPAAVAPKGGPGGPVEAWADKTETLTTQQDKVTYTVDASVKYGSQVGQPGANAIKGKILQQKPIQQGVPAH